MVYEFGWNGPKASGGTAWGAGTAVLWFGRSHCCGGSRISRLDAIQAEFTVLACTADPRIAHATDAPLASLRWACLGIFYASRSRRSTFQRPQRRLRDLAADRPQVHSRRSG